MAEIERTYFRRVFGGADIPALPFEEDPFREDEEADYSEAPDNDPATAVAAWQTEVGEAQLVIGRVESLSDVGQSGLPMRFWLMKTLNEYARHNGHADLLRERIDGAVGE